MVMDEIAFQERVEEEVQQIVTFAEAMTGLRSRWNGFVQVVDADTAALMFPVPFFAKKDWNCGITVLQSLLSSDGRWRSLLHEALHSVSVGLTEGSYNQFAPWEEAVVESLQRLYRPFLLQQIGVNADESRFAATESAWRFNPAVDALRRIASERPEVPAQTFLEEMLRMPLPDRPAFAFEWGRGAADFAHFKRVYAAASGLLR